MAYFPYFGFLLLDLDDYCLPEVDILSWERGQETTPPDWTWQEKENKNWQNLFSNKAPTHFTVSTHFPGLRIKTKSCVSRIWFTYFMGPLHIRFHSSLIFLSKILKLKSSILVWQKPFILLPKSNSTVALLPMQKPLRTPCFVIFFQLENCKPSCYGHCHSNIIFYVYFLSLLVFFCLFAHISLRHSACVGKLKHQSFFSIDFVHTSNVNF